MKSTVTKAVAEFRRTHADTWNVQKELFTEEQLEVAFLRNPNISRPVLENFIITSVSDFFS